MACQLQQLFSVGEEFEDEDFLSAVEATESQLPPPHAESGGLRPIGSLLRNQTGLSPTSRLLPSVTSTEMSPVLGISNLIPQPHLSTEKTLCLKTFAATPHPPPSTLSEKLSPFGLQNAGKLTTLHSDSFSSLAADISRTPSEFKFTRTTKGSHGTKLVDDDVGDDLDDALLLSAFEDLDRSGVRQRKHLEPSVNTIKGTFEPPSLGLRRATSSVTLQSENGCGSTLSKKPRVSTLLKSATGEEPVSAQTCNQQPASVDSRFADGPKERVNDSLVAQPCASFSVTDLGRTNGLSVCLERNEQQQPFLPESGIDQRANTVSQNITCTRINTMHGSKSVCQTPNLPRRPASQDILARNRQDVGSIGGKPMFSSPRMRQAQPGPCLNRNSVRTDKPDLNSPSFKRFSAGSFERSARLSSESSLLMTSIVTPSPSVKAPVSPAVASSSLQTPVVTNHLLQLVTAANKTPQYSTGKSSRAKIRRFPGPAGILPQQQNERNMDEILISTLHTPTHGAVAKPQTQEVTSTQQSGDEDFGRGPWMMMKTEQKLNEKDPFCFLRTCSVIMVLRKAALKQLPKNKVPNMAVMVKTLDRTSSDARAIFKDPTGEMQGTVHRQLLEEKQSEIKPGAVLLLKQVGIFSPSLRNHYLNVTPNNLIRVYPPDVKSWSVSQDSQTGEDDVNTNSLGCQETPISVPPPSVSRQMFIHNINSTICESIKTPIKPDRT
ncbi:homologous recombination OB-fold protein [Protopterus annectens]|uniref:homologous recombination OB-fold protein n=1 Tax=Protopterus annectens TaxID=7888 RepID=UPI001CFB9DCC|nr:homologous recombination OB-fold protein [Protopterus annectens]